MFSKKDYTHCSILLMKIELVLEQVLNKWKDKNSRITTTTDSLDTVIQSVIKNNSFVVECN